MKRLTNNGCNSLDVYDPKQELHVVSILRFLPPTPTSAAVKWTRGTVDVSSRFGIASTLFCGPLMSRKTKGKLKRVAVKNVDVLVNGFTDVQTTP